MPRRKKHHKRGKNKHKKRHGNNRQAHVPPTKPKDDINSSPEDHTLSDTLVSSTTVSCSTPLRGKRDRKDSFEMETPVRKLSLEEEKSENNQSEVDVLPDYTPLKTTPVNKRRSLHRQNEAILNGTWNMTNLNVLFDSNIVVQSSDILLPIRSSESRKRSCSSIPKLHSPGKEKPLSCHKSTQTMDEEELVQESRDEITETPRITQKILADFIDISKIQPNNSKNAYNQMMNSNKSNEVNINPYLKDKDSVSLDINAQRSRWQKEESAEELSFFSPQLYSLKSSSTPIQSQKLLNYLKDGVMKESLEMASSAKLEFINNKIEGTPRRETITKTPRSGGLREQMLNNSCDLTLTDPAPSRRENVNLNTPPLTEKVLNKDKSNSIKLLGSNKRRNSVGSISRIHNRTSPKIIRLVNQSRTFTKNVSYSRMSTSRRLYLDQSCEQRSPTIRMGLYERMMNKIKRYSRASARWSIKMMEVCAQLGIQIKNSLASLCHMYNENSMLDYSRSTCRCESYKMEVSGLNVKIDNLNEEVGHLRRQIEEYHCSQMTRNEDIGKLQEELSKVKQELSNFTDLRSELTSLKEQFQCFKNSTPTPVLQPSPVLKPVVPPPPPPPPPPMPLATPMVPPRLALCKKAKSSLGMVGAADKGDSRPVISLDEILKVKLKKASERPSVTPVYRQRATSNPLVHDDLFRQVRLRSSRLAMTTSTTTPNVASLLNPVCTSTPSSEQSTSPASSLNRLLDSSASVWRVKRLRKVGGYSLDSVHRISPVSSPASVAARREKNGS